MSVVLKPATCAAGFLRGLNVLSSFAKGRAAVVALIFRLRLPLLALPNQINQSFVIAQLSLGLGDHASDGRLPDVGAERRVATATQQITSRRWVLLLSIA